MKKLIALLLVFLMLVSSMATVFAAEISTAARACVDLGMLKGPTGTVDAAYTATEPSRLQVAIMLLRLKGFEADALAFSNAANFVDKDEVIWGGGKAVMAYLKAHPEFGWIGNKGYFSPNSPMSAQTYYKVLLESLGYTQAGNGVAGDFTWDGTLEFAASKGLKKAASAIPFTVNDMAVATLEALKCKLKGSTKTLAEELVEKGKMDKTAAIAAGVISAPLVFAVSKVETINLAELKVSFTDKLDKLSAENKKNYSLEEHEISSVIVQPDGKSVVLSLDTDQTPEEATPFEQGEEFILEINEISNEDKTQSVKNYKTKTLTAVDTEVPTIEKLELIGPYKVKLTFSEPIVDTSKAKVELDGDLYDATIGPANGTRDVYITLNVTLDDGKYDLTIYGFKDYVGFSNTKKTLTLIYKEVTSSPTVSVVSSSEKEVVVKFNRPVTDEDGEALDGNYFYHSNTSIHPEVTTKDNQTFILDFSYDQLPNGNVRLVVVNSVGGSAITDEWGNEMNSNTSFTLSITADETKPVVKEIKIVDEQTMSMYFSEALNIDSAADISNYIVMDKNDENIELLDAEYTIDAADEEYVVTLKFEKKLNGTYTIEITGIEDMAAQPNVIAPKILAFEMKDVMGVDLKAITATTVEGEDSKPDYIYISFPEEMMTEGQYGVLNKENYLLSDDVGDTFERLEKEDTVSLMAGGNAVKITLDDNSIFDVDDSDFRISIGSVADKAGNRSQLFAATINPEPDAPVEATHFVAISTSVVEVTFDGIIRTAPTSGFRISKNGGTKASPASVKLRYEDTNEDGSNETIAALTLRSTQQLSNSDAEGILEVSIMENNIKSETSLYCEESLDNEVSDGIAPAITKIYQSGFGEITIDFDEDIEATNAGLASTDLVLRDKNSKILLAGVDYNVVIDSSSLAIILIGSYEDYTGRITVDTKDKVTYIYDEDGENARLKPYGTPKALILAE